MANTLSYLDKYWDHELNNGLVKFQFLLPKPRLLVFIFYAIEAMAAAVYLNNIDYNKNADTHTQLPQ